MNGVQCFLLDRIMLGIGMESGNQVLFSDSQANMVNYKH